MNLVANDLARQAAEFGIDRRLVALIDLVHAFCKAPKPAGAVFGKQNVRLGVAVKDAARDELRDDVDSVVHLSRIVEHGAARAAKRTDVDVADAGMEDQRNAVFTGKRKDRIPARVIVVVQAFPQAKRRIALRRGALAFGERVIEIGFNLRLTLPRSPRGLLRLRVRHKINPLFAV